MESIYEQMNKIDDKESLNEKYNVRTLEDVKKLQESVNSNIITESTNETDVAIDWYCATGAADADGWPDEPLRDNEEFITAALDWWGKNKCMYGHVDDALGALKTEVLNQCKKIAESMGLDAKMIEAEDYRYRPCYKFVVVDPQFPTVLLQVFGKTSLISATWPMKWGRTGSITVKISTPPVEIPLLYYKKELVKYNDTVDEVVAQFEQYAKIIKYNIEEIRYKINEYTQKYS